MDTLHVLLTGNRPIQTIKLNRELTGVSLARAPVAVKEISDKMGAGRVGQGITAVERG